MKNNRFRNAGLWISVISFIPIVLESFGVAVLPEQWGVVKETLLALISLLVVFGILSNPTTENAGYSDDKEVTSDGDKTKVDTNL
jgi:uncharacterized membrane protein